MARKKAVTQASTETLEPRVYELGFLLSPVIREEDLDTRTDEIKEIITKTGATIISDGAPEFIDIAYEMVKVIDNKRVRFTQGYFGWIKFTVSPDQVKGILQSIESHALVIRALLVATVAENTVISKKPLSKILKATAREEIAEEEIIDGDTEDIDPGIAAVELQTPVNDEIEDMVDSIIDEPTETE